ncbi:MAG: HRDC domain-containing protein, partial [Desulfobacterales bacterium]
MEALERYRSKAASENGVMPYVIFHDRTLNEISVLKPKTIDELDGIHGIGEAKRRRYGKDIVDIVLKMEGGQSAHGPVNTRIT